jgi:hypothetical protein
MARPLLGILLVIACDSAGPTEPIPMSEVDAGALGAARTAWESRGPTAYTFVLERGNMWTSVTHRVTVVDGVVTRAEDFTTGETLTAEERLAIPIVEDLFDEMAEALLADTDWVGAAFDPLLRYPRRLFVDPSYAWADEEYYFVIMDFRALH